MDPKANVEKQIGPCGITCGTCFLGNGTMAKTMEEATQYINISGIKEWSQLVPGGTEINWVETEKALNWMYKYAYCAGCEEGGGPPDCSIRLCSSEKGYDLCNQCQELDKCEKFNLLGGAEGVKRETSSESRQEKVGNNFKGTGKSSINGKLVYTDSTHLYL
jgi:hypothetical protein